MGHARLTGVMGRADLPADISATKVAVSPTVATATVNFNTDGTITNHTGASIGNWFTPASAGIGALYDIKFHVTSGAALSSAPVADGTYIQMNAQRSFSNSASATTRVSVITWSLARTGTGVAIDTASGTIEADST